jgi:SAM-dependent methyltransferase
MIQEETMIRKLWLRLRQWMWIHRNSPKPVLRYVARGMWDMIDLLREIIGFFTSKNSRGITLMKLFQKDRVHQTTSATAVDRYPEIFSACRELLAEKTDLRILSFGCATGEEVFTLRRYFPGATLVGAEINKACLQVCRSKTWDDKVIFVESTPENLAEHGPYDAIFCMAVFQRSPDLVFARHMTDLKKIYPFRRFEAQLRELDALVKPGGLLVCQYSQYDLRDTCLAGKYTPETELNQDAYGFFVYGPDCKIKRQWQGRPCIFRKTE